eukprot:68000-Chlamydomonas_euryale.AAC.6
MLRPRERHPAAPLTHVSLTHHTPCHTLQPPTPAEAAWRPHPAAPLTRVSPRPHTPLPPQSAFTHTCRCGLASVILLLLYHIAHLMDHYLPYLKRLSMFENRSFYAPPTVATMENWKPEPQSDGEDDGAKSYMPTAA